MSSGTWTDCWQQVERKYVPEGCPKFVSFSGVYSISSIQGIWCSGALDGAPFYSLYYDFVIVYIIHYISTVY